MLAEEVTRNWDGYLLLSVTTDETSAMCKAWILLSPSSFYTAPKSLPFGCLSRSLRTTICRKFSDSSLAACSNTAKWSRCSSKPTCLIYINACASLICGPIFLRASGFLAYLHQWFLVNIWLPFSINFSNKDGFSSTHLFWLFWSVMNVRFKTKKICTTSCVP